MRMKAFLALLGLGLLLLLFAGCSDNNENEEENVGTVTGTVTNAATGLAVPGATVTLFRDSTQIAQTTTGSEGTYTFTNVPTGSGYTIQVSSSTGEFATVTTQSFTVTTGVTTVDVVVGTGIGGGTVTGTVTNASTGLAVSGATVTLLQDSTQIAQTTTASNGRFTFNNIPAGTYTIRVSSSTGAFTTVTTQPFTVVNGQTTTVNVVVGSGVGGTTISGTIGTTDPNATFDVSLLQNGNIIASTTTGTTPSGAEGPSFTLNNVPTGSGLLIQVTSPQHPGIITIFGPLTVPSAGLSGITIFTKTRAELSGDGIPTNASIATYIEGGGTITVNGQTSTFGNPTFLTGLAAGTYTVQINCDGTTLTFVGVPVVTGSTTVIRIAPSSIR